MERRSDFNPKGKSDDEVKILPILHDGTLAPHWTRRMPAGDIGVGGREIGYMFGCTRNFGNDFQAGVQPVRIISGGSLFVQKNGYGLVYSLRNASNQGKSSKEPKYQSAVQEMLHSLLGEYRSWRSASNHSIPVADS